MVYVMPRQGETKWRIAKACGSIERYADQRRGRPVCLPRIRVTSDHLGRHAGLPLPLRPRIQRFLVFISLALSVLASIGCGKHSDSNGEATLTLGAYSTPREAYSKAIIPE